MSTITLNYGTPVYDLDKKTGEVTMPDGKKFNPYTNENVDNLSLEELKVYNLERPTATQMGADTELERLAEAALVADMNAKEAADRQKAAKDAFKKALEARGALNPDTKGIGVVRTIIKKTRRFDKSLAEQLLTAEEIAKYSSIDSALVKANVAPSAYELMQKDFGYSLEVKVAD